MYKEVHPFLPMPFGRSFTHTPTWVLIWIAISWIQSLQLVTCFGILHFLSLSFQWHAWFRSVHTWCFELLTLSTIFQVSHLWDQGLHCIVMKKVAPRESLDTKCVMYCKILCSPWIPRISQKNTYTTPKQLLTLKSSWWRIPSSMKFRN